MTPFQSITFASPECSFDFLKHKLAFNKVGIKFDLGLKVGLFGPCSYSCQAGSDWPSQVQPRFGPGTTLCGHF